MNSMLISYLVSMSFCAFLIIQSAIYYLFISRNKELRRSKVDFLIIIVIALSIIVTDLTVPAGQTYPGSKELFDKLFIVFGITSLFFYIFFLRFISVSIKDSAFVETDGYKKKNRRFLAGLLIICALSILAVASFYMFKSLDNFYFIFQVILIIMLIGIGAVEGVEFSRILKNESGKISSLNLLRYKTLLYVGIFALLMGILEIIIDLMNLQWIYRTIGSPFSVGTGIMMIGLSLNFVFEYLNVLTRANDTNKKISELNRQMMDDVRTAQSLQISLLPLDKQKYIQNFIDMEISYMPMQSVGGDYYDFYKLDENNLLIFLGDASGHGVYAAMIWAILKVEVEELIENKYFNNLSQAFTLLNQRITRILENTYSYATLFACSVNLDSRVINFISAGHTDQLYYSRQENTVKRVRNKNPIIGTFKNAKFTADSINCRSGDVLLLFSDGIVEGIDPEGRQLGKERLEKIFYEVAKKSVTASEMIGDILIRLEDFFEGTLQKDDRTVMVIKL